jgi:hypothetical protein
MLGHLVSVFHDERPHAPGFFTRLRLSLQRLFRR